MLAERKKMRKREALNDFQFFDKEALTALYTKQEKLEDEKSKFVKQIAAIRSDAKTAPSIKSEKVEVAAGKSYEEMTEKADKMEAWLQSDEIVAKYSLSEEELQEKERLLDEGYREWNKSDFSLFKTALETNGRYNIEAIAADFEEETTHSKADVYKVRGGEERSEERRLERSDSKRVASPSCITNNLSLVTSLLARFAHRSTTSPS